LFTIVSGAVTCGHPAREAPTFVAYLTAGRVIDQTQFCNG